jgi:hypothetical protein
VTGAILTEYVVCPPVRPAVIGAKDTAHLGIAHHNTKSEAYLPCVDAALAVAGKDQNWLHRQIETAPPRATGRACPR